MGSAIYVVASVQLLIGALMHAGDTPTLALIIGFPVDRLGYYPRGADVPLFAGLPMWIISMLILTFGSLLSGSVPRFFFDRIRRRTHG